MIHELQKEIMLHANPQKAKDLAWFFKTNKGEYGEGDVFLGITVPVLRKIAKKHNKLSLNEIEQCISSKYHESRMIALLILIDKYAKDKANQTEIIDFYLKNTKYINNWDLIDLSAPKILGDYLLDKDKSRLYQLAKSDSLWEKRISILSTFAFIRQNQFVDALKIAEILLHDKHDLINKAVGWMLREVGKRNIITEEEFLQKYGIIMPRTMLRYAIEKFDEPKRKYYLNQK
jgi:3-methyladenine DNA glycosylase AlkD